MSVALVVALISLALSIVLFFYFRIYIRVQRKKAAEELLAEYRLEVQGLIADINLATDRDSLLVEERIKTLKNLLEDTDKRIAVYVNELERSRSGETLYSKLGPDFHHAAPETGDREITVPKKARRKTARPHTDSVPAEKQDVRIRIAELAIQGNNAADIASKLKISVSEVELALHLLQK